MDSEQLLIRVASSTDSDRWAAFVNSSPPSPPLNLLQWQFVLEEAYGVGCRFLLAETPTGDIRGIAASYVNDRSLFGLRFGLVTDSDRTAIDLLNAHLRYCRSEGIRFASVSTGYRPLAAVPPHLSEVERITVLMNLTEGERAIWRGLRDKTRNAVRKGHRAGIIADWGSHNLRAFHDIYLSAMSSHQRAAHSLSFFQKMFEHMPGSVQLLCARLAEKVIGGTIVITTPHVYLSAFQAASADANRRYAPTSFMTWELLRAAAAAGAHQLDLGESQAGSGAYTFKTNFGGKPSPVYYYQPTISAQQSPPSRLRARFEELLSTTVSERAPAWSKRHLAYRRARRGRII